MPYFFQFILEETFGNAQILRRLDLHQIGAHQGPADQRGLDFFQGVGQIQLYGQQVHGALELRGVVTGGRVEGRHDPRSFRTIRSDHGARLQSLLGGGVTGRWPTAPPP